MVLSPAIAGPRFAAKPVTAQKFGVDFKAPRREATLPPESAQVIQARLHHLADTVRSQDPAMAQRLALVESELEADRITYPQLMSMLQGEQQYLSARAR